MSVLDDLVLGTQREEAAPSVSVVLPCLNEEKSVGLCTDEALDAMTRAAITGEVVVVDNGCTDASVATAMASGARVVAESRSGYGSALLAGIAAARGSIVVMADADFTYDLSRIPELVAPIAAGDAEIVVGSRTDGANRRTMPFLHRFIGTPAITFLIARACGGITVRDSQSGFRAFRRQTVLDLDLRGTGMEFASEMLIRASHAGARIREIPTGYRPRIGESKLDTFSDGWRHLQLILALAPDLLLVGPGAALLAVGLVLSVLGLVSPTGVELGSLRWQPVFFSTIALVLGTQAFLAGSVLAHNLSVVSGSVCKRFAFVGRARFAADCLRGGIVLGLCGLAINGLLFLIWAGGGQAPTRGLALAALAQSLLIVGASLTTFGLVTALNPHRLRSRPRPDDAARPAVVIGS